MKQEFLDYLAKVRMSDVMINAIKQKYQLLCTASNINEFDDIVVSEMISMDGNREYFSLWGFSPNVLCKVSISSTDESKIAVFNQQNKIAKW